MLILSAHGGFPLFHAVALRGIVALAGLAEGKGNGKRATRAQIHTGAPCSPHVLGRELGRRSQLAMIVIIKQVIHKYSIKQAPGLHKQQQIL